MTIIFILVCFMVAAYFKAHMDAINDSGIKSFEWKNKYLLDSWDRPVSVNNKSHWWYFGLFKPKYSEKFPFSSTALVFLTDRWHAYQMMTFRFLYLGASFAYSTNLWVVLLLTFVIFPVVVGTTFEIFYTNVKKCYQSPNKRMKSKKTKKIKNSNEENFDFSELPFTGQVTSVPEKQIGD